MKGTPTNQTFPDYTRRDRESFLRSAAAMPLKI